jgi:hypothetical protein
VSEQVGEREEFLQRRLQLRRHGGRGKQQQQQQLAARGGGGNGGASPAWAREIVVTGVGYRCFIRRALAVAEQQAGLGRQDAGPSARTVAQEDAKRLMRISSTIRLGGLLLLLRKEDEAEAMRKAMGQV